MARQGLRCYRWMRIYSLLAPASVVVPTLLIGRPIMHIWPESDHPLHLWTYVAWVSIVTLYCGVAYFQFFSLVLGVQLGNAALYVGLNALLERPNFTTSTLQAVAKRHAHLSAVTHEVNEVLSEYLTYFLVNALFLPALAVCDLIFKGFDPLSLVNLPLVVMQFVPLCLTGQILEDNSGYKFRFKVYSMPWTERSIAFRRLCLTMMSRSMRKASVVAWGIGNLQREACFNALKNWFKYLQLMFQMNKT